MTAIDRDQVLAELEAESLNWDGDGASSLGCLREALAALPATSQEPGLSKEWLDELIEPLLRRAEQGMEAVIIPKWQAREIVGAWLSGANDLRDAILSAPSGPLSDPKGEICHTTHGGAGIKLRRAGEHFKSECYDRAELETLRAALPAIPLDREALIEAIKNLCYQQMQNVGTDAALARAVFCQDKLLPLIADAEIEKLRGALPVLETKEETT